MPDRPEIRYLPCRCVLRNERVWAIMAKQADGRWTIVNCLDKDTPCFRQPCVFTMDGGGWPFGRAVFVSELYEALERLEAVDHVTSLTCSTADASRLNLTANGKLVGLALRSYELPSPQIILHDVAVEMG